MQVKRKGDPVRRSSAVSDDAKKQMEEVRGMLMQRVPNANPSDDFLVKVASTYFLSNKNKSVIDAAVKRLQQ